MYHGGLVFEDGDEFPALELAQGAGFTDEDAIAGLGFALLVVGVKLVVHADDLLEFGMGDAALDADDDRLLHLGGDEAGHPHPLHHPRGENISFMKILDVRNLTDSELVTRKREARQEYFNLRLQQQTGALERPSRLNELRKDVAKLETVLSERRLGLKVQSRTAKKPAAEAKSEKKKK